MGAFFERHGIDVEALRRCIAHFCEQRLLPPAEVQLGRGQRSLSSRPAIEDLLAQPEGRTLADLLSEMFRRSRG